MAFDLGSVIAYIKADISDFQSGMQKAQSEAGNLTSSIGDLGAAVADFGNKAAIFTGVVTAGFLAMGKTALDSTATYEQSRIAFETMLGSAEKAKKLLTEISDFAEKTPFELPQLVDGAKRLLAYNLAGEEVIPTLKMLGNMAAGVGTEKLPQLILAFGQVKAATKLTGAELRQFSEAGVPLLQALVDQANKAGGMLVKVGGAAKGAKVDVGEMNDKLAIAKKRLEEATVKGKAKESTMMSLRNTVQNYEEKLSKANATGKAAAEGYVRQKVTAEQMIGLISDGQVKFEDVQKALSGMTGEGGKFFNLMERQSATFSGVVSNIQDSIGRMMRSFMGIDVKGDVRGNSIFGMFKSSAEGFMKFLEQMTPRIEYVGGAIGIAMSYLTGTFNHQLMDDATFDKYLEFIVMMEKVKSALSPLGDWIAANKDLVFTFLQGLAVGFGALLIIGTIAAALGLLLNPLTLLVLGVAALYTAWQTDFLGIQTITMAFADFLTMIFTTYILPALQMFTDWLNLYFWPAWNNVFNLLIVPMFNAFIVWFQERWGYIRLLVELAWNLIKGVITIAWNFISGYLTAGMQILAGDWKGAHETIQNIATKNWEAIKGIFNGVVDFLKGWGGMVLSSIVRPFEEAWGKVKDLADKIKGAMDPNQRHSPSLVDRVEKGVNDLNSAWGSLDFGVSSMSSQYSPSQVGLAPTAAMAGGGTTIVVDMAGAYIGSEQVAQEMGEKIGDEIVKKLQINLKI